MLSSEAETLLGRWELGQGKRKCSPPKACSVMLRHRDSRVGLISRSGPGTGQSEGEKEQKRALNQVQKQNLGDKGLDGLVWGRG